jgi:hypothetical protein
MASKRQKASGYLLPDELPAELCEVHFCIPDAPEIRAAMRGAIYQLASYWSWERTDGKPRAVDAAQLILETLTDTYCEGGMKLTGDGCGRVYVQNCGEDTPQLLLDLSCAIDQSVAAEDIAAARAQLDELSKLYTTQGTAGVAPYTTEVLQTHRDVAMCYATEAIVDLIAKTEIERRESEGNIFTRIVKAVVEYAVSFVLFWLVGLPLMVAVVVAEVVSSAVAGALHLVNTTDLESPTRLKATACCISSYWSGGILPNYTGWKLAIEEGFSCPDDIPEIYPLLADYDVYLAWLNMVETSINRVIQLGLTCDCDFGNPQGQITWPAPGEVEYSGLIVGDVDNALQYNREATYGYGGADAYVCQPGPMETCTYDYRHWGYIEIPVYLTDCPNLFVEVRGWCGYGNPAPGQDTNYTYSLYQGGEYVQGVGDSPSWTDTTQAIRVTGLKFSEPVTEGQYTLRLYNSRCTDNAMFKSIRIDRVRIWANRDSANYHEVYS